MILVIDDNPDIQDALGDVLHDSGYDVAFASDGNAALSYLRSHEPPALILLDLMMPGMDGFAFRAEQRNDPQLAGIPVAVLSAHDALGSRSRELEAQAYFEKPVRVQALLSTIRRLVPAT